jgi:hypothetical protein
MEGFNLEVIVFKYIVRFRRKLCWKLVGLHSHNTLTYWKTPTLLKHTKGKRIGEGKETSIVLYFPSTLLLRN